MSNEFDLQLDPIPYYQPTLDLQHWFYDAIIRIFDWLEANSEHDGVKALCESFQCTSKEFAEYIPTIKSYVEKIWKNGETVNVELPQEIESCFLFLISSILSLAYCYRSELMKFSDPKECAGLIFDRLKEEFDRFGEECRAAKEKREGFVIIDLSAETK